MPLNIPRTGFGDDAAALDEVEMEHAWMAPDNDDPLLTYCCDLLTKKGNGAGLLSGHPHGNSRHVLGYPSGQPSGQGSR